VRAWWIRVVTTVASVGGVIELCSATAPTAPDERDALGRFTAAIADGGLARVGAVGVGLTVVVLAAGVWGRRLLAQQLSVGVLILAALAAGYGHSLQPRRLGILCLGVAVLWALRGDFPVRPDPHRRRRATMLAGAGAAAVSWWLLTGGTRFSGWHQLTAGRGALTAVVEAGVVLAATGAGVVALVWAFLPAPAPPAAPQGQRARVAALVGHADCDSLAPFATRADRTYAFSPDGRAAIGYRVLFGTALVGGDPVGAVDAAPAAITAFLRTCDRQGWRPAVLGASAGMAGRWRTMGLPRRVPIGDEAIVDLSAFVLDSRRMRNVRQAIARTRNAGVTVTVGPMDAATAGALRPVLDDWLRHRPERGFAMNLDRILVPRDGTVVAIAYDRHHRPQAFARFAVSAGGRTLTLDVAPRRRTAPNGIVERLFFEVATYGRQRGAAELSLNFAGLRRLLTSQGRVGRCAGGAIGLFDHWIQIAPLYRFVAKFHPGWRPRWLLLRSWPQLRRRRAGRRGPRPRRWATGGAAPRRRGGCRRRAGRRRAPGHAPRPGPRLIVQRAMDVIGDADPWFYANPIWIMPRR
jgi:lysyl-tRNA synthetase class 2